MATGLFTCLPAAPGVPGHRISCPDIDRTLKVPVAYALRIRPHCRQYRPCSEFAKWTSLRSIRQGNQPASQLEGTRIRSWPSTQYCVWPWTLLEFTPRPIVDLPPKIVRSGIA
jgi:hypothetical protein